MKSTGMILLICIVFVLLPSVPGIRAILASPLVITDESASGDACYVMSAGNALGERLAAASDLYHMKRVPKIILMQDNERGPYSFTARTSWNRTQWAMEYLVWRGVPRESILIIQEYKGRWGTLLEARNLARIPAPELKKLVLVTSAPHTRRSLYTFRRVLSPNIRIVPFAATSFEASYEMYNPIWLEYLKLLVYRIIA
jgi:uncharacterized SAM-binding protein YcdF (DUF218 family)